MLVLFNAGRYTGAHAATVMVEGKPYVKLGGSIGRYPKFQPEDYVILR